MNDFTFSVPQNIMVGRGSLAKLPEAAKQLGGSHAFIISGPHLTKMGLVGKVSDSLKAAGFAVDAVDGSAEMVKAASELTGHKVEHATFADFKPKGGYDGIWACSSLLHVPAAELPAIVAKYAAALKPGGCFYLSFKIGDYDGMRNGRWFTDMTEQSFRRLIDDTEDLTVDRIDVTSDVRPGRVDEKWLNAWCMRI